jgi:hypothetical protein
MSVRELSQGRLPLRGLRLIATLPPRDWFGGWDYACAVDLADDLRRLGAIVFDLDVTPFCARHASDIEEATAAVRSFRADLAIALPNAGYGLLCRNLDGEHLFADVLEIPTILIWDHGILQFAPLVLGTLPENLEESQGGCLRRLRAALDRPLFVHYSPDRGHVAAMDALGIVNRNKVQSFVHTAWPAYVRHGRTNEGPTGLRSQVAFAGNVYLEGSRNLRFRRHEVLRGIEDRMLQARRANLTASFWDLLGAEIDALDAPLREELRLQPDWSFFWRFMQGEIEIVGTTEARLSVLGALRRPCDFYGNFMESEMTPRLGEFGLTFRGNLNCITELPFLFGSADLMIDVVHPGYISGVSPKILACMACGGMVLFDYKDDFRQEIGDLAELVMFRSIDHMNALVEGHLSDPARRRRIARELQHRVLTGLTFDAFLKRVLIEEPVWRNSRMNAAREPEVATAGAAL